MLQQFDVVTAPANAGFPYLIILQSDLLEGLATRIACPLVDAATVDPLATLWPKVMIANGQYVVLVPRMLSITADPSAAAVTNLVASSDAIMGAVNLVFDAPS